MIFKAPLPLSIVSILIIDLLINLLLEFALKKEQSEDLETHLSGHLLISGLTTGAIITGIYFWNLIRLGWYPGEAISQEKANTMVFILLCLTQILAAHSLRNNQKSIFLNPPLKNLYLTLTSILAVLILYALTNFNLLNLPTLSSLDWPLIIFALIVILIIEEVRKYLIRKNEISENKSHSKKP
ncbi:MAG: cation-translocating P-type ATPase C-terminal domain-containing protein [bacterium]|nr:cation-translocating P-type ATPase C-terminal domain-containing protein [bacterium]